MCRDSRNRIGHKLYGQWVEAGLKPGIDEKYSPPPENYLDLTLIHICFLRRKRDFPANFDADPAP
ncbi:MAG: hypothetical protein WCX31_13780 [Salinivirgaceae bacterium]|jgi:hypothetical protein